jgi:hypothetical protein
VIVVPDWIDYWWYVVAGSSEFCETHGLRITRVSTASKREGEPLEMISVLSLSLLLQDTRGAHAVLANVGYDLSTSRTLIVDLV